MSMQVNCTGNLGLVCGLLTPFSLLTSYFYILVYNLNVDRIAKVVVFYSEFLYYLFIM